MHTCLSILITLLLSVLGFSPDAMADVRDHLGSTRAVIDEAGELLQTVNGLNLHDFHARWQDYATGRFTTLDPMATDYGHLSPYTYCAKKIDSNYGNQEERAVILGEESETAKKLGKIFPNELTRKGHSGTIYPAESPTSDEVNGYIVTPNIYNHE